MTADNSSLRRHWDARYLTPVPHDTSYYLKCLTAGSLACGITHAGITPLDVAKVNMQVYPQKYTSTLRAIPLLLREEGSIGIWKGVGPAFVGYSLQGMFKFGFYEAIKDQYLNLAGEELSSKYKPAIWLAASASAEVVADIALCPFEMTKVKMQTSSSGTFPMKFLPALKEMSRLRGETRYPFGSLPAIWSRQIPYTMAKFFCFEATVQAFYTYLLTQPKETYSPVTQLGVTFASGYLAGIVSALVSQPADSLVSLLGKSENAGKSVGTIVGEVGWVTLVTKGLGARVVMVGTLTGLQWWIYDACKTAMGAGTTGGK
ncbi:Cu/Pi carrier [Marasmius crinis-equi]|uniref:Cu/Pi carrier n=1 Tax=Marasmius crinis-equi TaxID=585013 RepID=A0ABR3FH22_9AGAR